MTGVCLKSLTCVTYDARTVAQRLSVTITNRNTLKEKLIEIRFDCDWCDRPLVGEGDMHEWLIKRSALPKNKRIFDERNCAILHHSCHMAHGQTRAMQDKLAPIFVQRYGKDKMLDFIDGLGMKAPQQFVHIIEAVVY